VSFFAVLSEGERPESSFDVLSCHVNLLSLPGLLGHRRLLCDVGLHIRAADNGIAGVELHLPFGTEASRLQDLSEVMKHHATLVFGKLVEVKNGEIWFDNGPVPLVAADLDACDLIARRSARDYSTWRIRFSTALEPHGEGYSRIRFPVTAAGATWTGKRSGLAINRVLVDMRFADLREILEEKNWKGIEPRVATIQDLRLFVAVPSYLQFRQASPDPLYVRLLEGAAWEPYVGRAMEIVRRRKYFVYQWRGADISTTQPMRVLLDLSRDVPLLGIWNYLRIAVVSLSLAAVLFKVPLRLNGQTFWDRVHPSVTLPISAVLGLVWGLSARLPQVAGAGRFLRKLCLRGEDLIIRLVKVFWKRGMTDVL
jgi:hypothetical protein